MHHSTNKEKKKDLQQANLEKDLYQKAKLESQMPSYNTHNNMTNGMSSSFSHLPRGGSDIAEIESLMALDQQPIESKVIPRWQRKQQKGLLSNDSDKVRLGHKYGMM